MEREFGLCARRRPILLRLQREDLRWRRALRRRQRRWTARLPGGGEQSPREPSGDLHQHRLRLGKQFGSSPLPELTGVADASYDLVAVLDVVEHVEDDVAALKAIARVLKPGGKILITVPAHQWMWSAHDVVNHHQRRYSKRALTTLIEQSPLKLEAIGYLNSLLFPVALAERLASKVTGKEEANLAPPAEPINQALERIFALERRVIGRFPLPPGLSLFAIASAT